MPAILIKNNLKLMLRSKWILLMMIFLPLIIIALLSNAFQEMLNTSYQIEAFQVGYRISDGNNFKDEIPVLKSLCEENDVILQEYPEGEITKLLKEESVSVFVDISKDSYKIYQSNDRKTEAAIVESILYSFFYQVKNAETIGSYMREENLAAFSQPLVSNMEIESAVLPTEPVASSIDYYGIIYIIYTAWCGMISLVAVISSERKNVILRRMRISQMSKWQYYIGKFIPSTMAIFIEISIALGLSVLLFDIHWGNIGLSIFLIFLIAMAASAFGIVLFQLFRNASISIVLGFTIIWVAGYLGGSFQTYMYANLPKTLVNASPIYYINRTLVEYSTKGYSDYTLPCIGYLVGIILVSGVFGILLMNRKMEEQ